MTKRQQWERRRMRNSGNVRGMKDRKGCGREMTDKKRKHQNVESQEEEEERWKIRRKRTIIKRRNVVVSKRQNNCIHFHILVE